MTIQDLENIIVNCFTTLNAEGLYKLNSQVYYSGLDKEQIIEELEKEINKLKVKGVKELKSEVTSCDYCYPFANAFNFLDKNTGEFILRYVIHQENIIEFKVEQCKNRYLPSSKDGLPF